MGLRVSRVSQLVYWKIIWRLEKLTRFILVKLGTHDALRKSLAHLDDDEMLAMTTLDLELGLARPPKRRIQT
jgi:hypothetical protein